MADIKAFTSLLEQTVSAPRLSGSKVQSLTSLSQSLTAANQDTELITTFYRINAGLPPASQGRISSLYVFDAIARAARKDADKERDKGKAREGRGMTGLISKMEGVVDAWVGGMVDDGKGGMWTEGKDKVRKVLDIWTKGTTFPSSTLDRLQSKIATSEAGPSRLPGGSNGYSSVPQSTTPPGEPPAPMFSPVLPPLSLPGDVPVISGSNTAPPPPSSSTEANLPPEILRLLGLQNGAGKTVTTSTPTPPPQSSTAASAVDIAALLASVRPAPPNAGGPVSQNVSNAPTTIAPNPALPFNLDPRQLAALASLAGASTGTTPPHPNYPLPGSSGYNQPPFPPSSAAQPFPPFPPSGASLYPNQPDRGQPRRDSDGRSPPYTARSNGYDRGTFSPGGMGGYGERRDPPNRGWDRPDGPDRRTSREGGGGGYGGRPRSRSPPRRDGPNNRFEAPPMGDNGYGNMSRGHQTRGSMDDRGPVDRPIAKKNYGGFKNQAGRFDPPPSSAAGVPGVPPPQQQQQQQQGGRAPLPPGRDIEGSNAGGSRAPLPPGRDMDDQPDQSSFGNGSQSNQPDPQSTQSFSGDQPASTIFNKGGPRLETFDLSTFNPMMPESWAALADAWRGTTGREPGQMELMGFLAGQGPVMPMGMGGDQMDARGWS